MRNGVQMTERREAGGGHCRNNSAGITALLDKSSHTRTHSEMSSDSSATFVVNVVPDGEVGEGSASFTDSDTVPFRTAADELSDDWEGQKQHLQQFSGTAYLYVRRRAAQERNLLSRQWRMYVTVCLSLSII